VIAGIRAALNLECCDPDLVAVEARRAIHPGQAPSIVAPKDAVDDRPAPSPEGYDQLLAGVLA